MDEGICAEDEWCQLEDQGRGAAAAAVVRQHARVAAAACLYPLISATQYMQNERYNAALTKSRLPAWHGPSRHHCYNML